MEGKNKMKKLLIIFALFFTISIYSQYKYSPFDFQIIKYSVSDTTVTMEADMLSMRTHEPTNNIFIFSVLKSFKNEYPVGTIFNLPQIEQREYIKMRGLR